MLRVGFIEPYRSPRDWHAALTSWELFRASPDPLSMSHLPRGMMERYLPLNLLAIVISCHNVHPRLEKTWWAAAGGWWLTWKREEKAREVPATPSV